MKMLIVNILLAHLLADFVFQPYSLVKSKRIGWSGIFVHVLIHGLFLMVLLLPNSVNFVNFVLILVICLIHGIVDHLKIRFEKMISNLNLAYWLDQILHIGVLILVGNFFVIEKMFWISEILAAYFGLQILATKFWEVTKFQYLRKIQFETGKEVEFLEPKFDYKGMFFRSGLVVLSFGVMIFFQARN